MAKGAQQGGGASLAAANSCLHHLLTEGQVSSGLNWARLGKTMLGLVGFGRVAVLWSAQGAEPGCSHGLLLLCVCISQGATSTLCMCCASLRYTCCAVRAVLFYSICAVLYVLCLCSGPTACEPGRQAVGCGVGCLNAIRSCSIHHALRCVQGSENM